MNHDKKNKKRDRKRLGIPAQRDISFFLNADSKYICVSFGGVIRYLYGSDLSENQIMKLVAVVPVVQDGQNASPTLRRRNCEVALRAHVLF